MSKVLNKNKDRGAALITVMMVSALVLGLFAMTFTNSMVGEAVVSANQNRRIGMECAYGDVDLAVEVVAQLLDNEPLPPGTIVHVDTPNELAADSAINNPWANAVDENGNVIDDVAVQPDLLISADLPGCPRTNDTAVDIDYIHNRKLDEGVLSTGEASHELVGGMACPQGWNVYALTVLTTTAQGISRIESAYADCA